MIRRLLALAMAAAALGAAASGSSPPSAPGDSLTSADWLGLLPEGEEKRRFILDCTGCHVTDQRIVRSGGRPRSRATWSADVARMLRFSGATSKFPVIAHDRDSTATAEYLARHLAGTPRRRPPAPARHVAGAVTEYEMPVAGDLPHDVAVDARGRVVITGMFTHVLYVLDPARGTLDTVPIPVAHANPRAVEIDSTGAWWLVLGGPKMLARHDPATGAWRTYPMGFYPHSLALGRPGEVWANGHFTRAPELIGRIHAASGARDTFVVPPHPRLDRVPGGPIPYEIRIGPDGRVWGSELQGNRLFVLDPGGGGFRTYDLPMSHGGPRRFDVGPDGALWIPAYAANELLRLDPASGTFERHRLPLPDAVPYVARIDPASGVVWIGTAAADAVLAFDPRARSFTVYPLPSRGALVRHLAIDPRTREVWAAYGASPGTLGARIARIRPAAEDGSRPGR